MSTLATLLALVAALAGAPLLVAMVNRTKALVAGRRGAPLLQPYRDLRKLASRGAVYSDRTTWAFRLGPVVSTTALVLAALMVPLGPVAAPLAFGGDLILVSGLFALGRYLTIVAALDTGSSFEGMGASREAHFGALAEPALFLALAVLVRLSGEASLSGAIGATTAGLWLAAMPALAMAAVALLILVLVENSRMPVDDPTTHLELTMIHEVMVLDHSGPDLALIHYGAGLKLWLLGALLAGVLVPVHVANPLLDLAAMLGAMVGIGVLVGLIESLVARLKLLAVPALVITAATLAGVAFVTTLG